jgi:hypothetical protein
MGSPASRCQKIVVLFTRIWLIGSLIVSAYFAFWLFPEVYDRRTSATVQLMFQTKDLSNGSIVYYPNLETFRRQYLKSLSDQTYLYFSGCEILPLSQRPMCDPTTNWKKLDPHVLNCTDAATCSTTSYTISETQRYMYLVGLKTTTGDSFSISDLPPPPLSDLAGWGNAAKWPLFFVCLFFALKLGRSLVEFLSLPYEK